MEKSTYVLDILPYLHSGGELCVKCGAPCKFSCGWKEYVESIELKHEV